VCLRPGERGVRDPDVESLFHEHSLSQNHRAQRPGTTSCFCFVLFLSDFSLSFSVQAATMGARHHAGQLVHVPIDINNTKAKKCCSFVFTVHALFFFFFIIGKTTDEIPVLFSQQSEECRSVLRGSDTQPPKKHKLHLSKCTPPTRTKNAGLSSHPVHRVHA
jgi:hypothetical protein